MILLTKYVRTLRVSSKLEEKSKFFMERWAITVTRKINSILAPKLKYHGGQITRP